MRFEEDSILNNYDLVENENFEEDETGIEELYDEEYYNQLMEDLINEICIEMRDYCHYYSVFLCEKIKTDDILYLLN